MLRVDGLKLTRGGFSLGPLSLEIDGGQYLALVGPSGSGKTLLLEWMAGFEQAETGALHVDGKDVTSLPPQRRPIGIVYQDSALFPHMTVRDNIAFAQRVQGIEGKEAQHRIAALAESLALEGRLDHDVRSLSGGEARRVALARVLVEPRPVLLLDEPLSALDAHLRWQLLSQLDALRSRLGLTLVHVTHDISMVASVASHVAVLYEGQLLQTGWCQDVLAHPTDARVAAAVGAVNFARGRGDDDGERLHLPQGGELPAARVPAKEVCMRFEGLRASDSDGKSRVAGTCVGVLRSGTDGGPRMRVQLDLPGEPTVVELESGAETAVGDTLFVDFSDATYDFY